jgi:hypothetical protein
MQTPKTFSYMISEWPNMKITTPIKAVKECLLVQACREATVYKRSMQKNYM